MRLRRTSPAQPGWRRRRRGRGFEYLDEQGRALRDPQHLERVKSLAIPPAWTDVWICPLPQGHLQAVGTDSAGRRQYLYHPEWRTKRDAAKHERVLELAGRLPRARKRSHAALRSDSLDRSRVLGAAFRMLDLGSFRIGSETYTDQNDTYGLATFRREHVKVRGRSVTFHYIAKGAAERVQRVVDASLAKVLRELIERDEDGAELLAWCQDGRWHDVHSSDVNEHLRALMDGDFTAKDFRTWNATVLMAQLLAIERDARTVSARRRAVKEAYETVADYLGNTPTIARTSYVDPRVVELYNDGVVLPARSLPKRRLDLPVHGRVERSVYSMLRRPRRH